jgi:hypothetical protein
LSIEIQLHAHPDNLRERDDQAIEWLKGILDESGRPGECWPFTNERWSLIIERRIQNKYSAQRGARAMWMHRHYHVRQLGRTESPEESAAHVAAIWSKHGRLVKASTISAAAKLGDSKDAALLWIEECQKADNSVKIPGRPVATDEAMYQALERAIERDIAPAYPVAPKKSKR